MKGVVIAGTHSGCGKTTVTIGLIAAMRKKGLVVQPFKAGPDFIDSGLHRLVAGRYSRNLDLWMCGEDFVKACFYRHSQDADISIVEGVMGMYDGDHNTQRLASILGLPVILVVDAYGMAESAGAVVEGFRIFSDSLIKGVIFNRVASERHYDRLKNSIKGVPVLGYLPRDLNFEIPHRHLGLMVAEEAPISGEKIERLRDAVLAHIDVDLIIKIVPEFKNSMVQGFKGPDPQYKGPSGRGAVIAVARDRAFCFYYEDNLDLLKDAGAKIVTFSPLSDTILPEDIDAIYIGGGYPELYAEELSKNLSMLEAIYRWADSGRPLYAECGGLMYLSEGIHDFEGNFFRMAGVFPFETIMKKDRFMLGYREIQLTEDCLLGSRGERLRGHEFHYSAIKPSGGHQPSRLTTCYLLSDSMERGLSYEGYRYKNTFASYVHVHFGSNLDIARSFIEFIKECPWKT